MRKPGLELAVHTVAGAFGRVANRTQVYGYPLNCRRNGTASAFVPDTKYGSPPPVTAVAYRSHGTYPYLYVALANSYQSYSNYFDMKSGIAAYTVANAQSARSLEGTFTKAVHLPVALAIDNNSNPYVANAGTYAYSSGKGGSGGTVTEYAPVANPSSSDAPSRTIEIGYPLALVTDGNGNLYVGDLSGPSVKVYPTGASTPSYTINVQGQTYAPNRISLAIDSANDRMAAQSLRIRAQVDGNSDWRRRAALALARL
jgi:hypothetical protein